MFMELINFQHSKISAKHCNFGLLSQVPLAPIKAKSIRLKITHIYIYLSGFTYHQAHYQRPNNIDRNTDVH